MAIKLNAKAVAHAEKLIKANEVEHAASWAENNPDKDEQARFLNTHNLEEYGEWFLGIDDAAEKSNSKDKYTYPIGDFNEIFQSAIQEAQQKAKSANHQEIANAAQNLLTLIARHKK